MPNADKLIMPLALMIAAPAAAGMDRDAQFNAAAVQAQSVISLNLAEAAMPKVMGVAPQAQPQPERVLQSVMVAMNDGPATAGLLVSWLRENQAKIEFNAEAKGLSSHAWVSGKPAVALAPSLAAEPVSYRYVAVYLAKETAALMLKDVPDSAEKRYIAASRVAETFFELGGTRLTMGNMDGRHDAQMESTIRLWVENDPVGGVVYLQKQGVPTLAEVRAKAAAKASQLGELIHIINDQMLTVPNDPNADSFRQEAAEAEIARTEALETTAAADAAIKEFETFKSQEKDWLWQNQGMLQ